MLHFRPTLFLFLLLPGLLHAGTYRVGVIRKGKQENLVSVRPVAWEAKSQSRRKILSLPLYMREDAPPSKEIFEEYLVEESALKTREKTFFLQQKSAQILKKFPLSTEVRTLVSQGNPENRVDLTILGDGYQESEKERFFADARRITQGLFGGNTFKSFLPLFNVHAVFVASRESGVGDGAEKDTAFSLYRDPAGSKRAIMPGNSAALEQALHLAPDTDYPIVIANDDYYGGLGGRYAISTRSERSGLIVLRHELGHNFGQVGEEYDNGYVYRGANSAPSSRAPWNHWAEQGLSRFESSLLSGDYVWQNLQHKSYGTEFTIPSPHSLLTVTLSSVGWESDQDVLITFDGKVLPVKGEYHDDRGFFNAGPLNVTPKSHHTFEIKEQVHDGDNVLGFALFHSYPADYDFTPHRIGAYSTFDAYGRTFYRPTHNSCLMRNMEVDYFCVVDQENIWHKLLDRVNLIDSVELKREGAELLVDVKTPPLPGLLFSWYRREGRRLILLEEKVPRAQKRLPSGAQYQVQVELRSPEVRKSSSRFSASADF